MVWPEHIETRQKHIVDGILLHELPYHLFGDISCGAEIVLFSAPASTVAPAKLILKKHNLASRAVGPQPKFLITAPAPQRISNYGSGSTKNF